MTLRNRYVLPPPPNPDQDINDYAWRDWFRQLRDYIVNKGSILWQQIDFTGSNITDIVTRRHNDLQAFQGGSSALKQYYHIDAQEYAAASRLSWNTQDGTVNIDMGLDGVVQQVGLEQYMVVKNNTGSTLLNGKAIGFAGSDAGRVEGQYYIADGTIPSIYFIGVATMDIDDGQEGYVTTYGYVRDLDTSAWSVGDILYADPNTAGALTNVKPTVPDLTIPVAAVLTSNTTTGVIMVRPTLTLNLSYGTFQDTTPQSIAAVNTAQAITFDTTDTSNGISRGTPTSRIVVANSGQYEFSFSLQVKTGSSSTKTVYIWIRKNGTDVDGSTREITISGNSEIIIPSWSYQVSLNANEYLELMWAADSTNVTLTPAAATAFAPSTASAKLNVAQVNQ